MIHYTMQIAGRLQRMTCPLCNLSLQRLHRVRWCHIMQFSLYLSGSVGNRNPLQIMEDISHVATSNCSLQWFHEQSMQSLQKAETISTLFNLNNLQSKLLRGHVTRFSLRATCLSHTKNVAPYNTNFRAPF